MGAKPMHLLANGLRYEINDGIASLVLDRPDRLNLLTREILSALDQVASELASNGEVNVLTITGEGDSCFSVGLLTPELRASLSKPEVLDLIRLANKAFDRLEALPQIVIAGLNGFVRAGAVELILACDIRVSGQHASLASPEAKWGGFPGAGAPVRLPALIGMGHTIELLCSGREIGADEMARLGLVQHVVPHDRVRSSVLALAKAIAENGPLATRGIKRIARTRQRSGFRAARDLSDEMRAALEWTQDVDEGIAAALEKRTPRFVGK